MKIMIKKDPIEKGVYLYKNDCLEINNGITIIIGKNGIGKTTLLRQIKNYCKKNNLPCFDYDNYNEGGEHAKSSYGFFGDFESLAQTLFHSEGQQIFYNFGKTLKKLGKFVAENKGKEKLVILFDAVDSGLDVDGIEQLKDICNIIIRDNPTQEIYFLITANNYALIHEMNCFDVYNWKYMYFDNYCDYKEFIQKQYKE